MSPPLFSSSRGAEVCQYGQLSSNPPPPPPLESFSVAKLRNAPHCIVGNADLSPKTTLQWSSGKLVYAAERMRKTTYFLGKRKQNKVKEEVIIFERRREEVTWWKRWGRVFAQARLGFWWGLFPVRPGKCGPQLSRLMKATTCSSLKASLCFRAASSCSSEHTIYQQDRGKHRQQRRQTLKVRCKPSFPIW